MNLCILQSKCGTRQTRKNSEFGYFSHNESTTNADNEERNKSNVETGQKLILLKTHRRLIIQKFQKCAIEILVGITKIL